MFPCKAWLTAWANNWTPELKLVHDPSPTGLTRSQEGYQSALPRPLATPSPACVSTPAVQVEILGGITGRARLHHSFRRRGHLNKKELDLRAPLSPTSPPVSRGASQLYFTPFPISPTSLVEFCRQSYGTEGAFTHSRVSLSRRERRIRSVGHCAARGATFPTVSGPPGQEDVGRGRVLPAGCRLAERAARLRAAAGVLGSPRARRIPGHRGPRRRADWRRRAACALRRGCGSRPCWRRRQQRAEHGWSGRRLITRLNPPPRARRPHCRRPLAARARSAGKGDPERRRAPDPVCARLHLLLIAHGQLLLS